MYLFPLVPRSPLLSEIKRDQRHSGDGDRETTGNSVHYH